MYAIPMSHPTEIAPKAKMTSVLPVRLSPDVLARLMATAGRLGLPTSSLARMAIVGYLDRAGESPLLSAEEANLVSELRALEIPMAPHLEALIADVSTGRN